MRLKHNRVKRFYHRPAIPQKDNEGNSYIAYGPAQALEAEEWPVGGKLQTEMYGQRLPNIRNLRIQGKFHEISENGCLRYQIDGGPSITAGDGVCLNVSPEREPDYRIIAIYPYHFLTLEVEKR